jgi:cobalt-zinc-cadmium efflux system protein
VSARAVFTTAIGSWLPGQSAANHRVTILGVGHDHDHHVAPDASNGRLATALGLILAFMAVEVVAGILADSLALLSDAAHMLTDAGAIGLALVAARLAARPAAGGFTFGLKRAEILSAQVNGVTLVALAAVILAEGIQRLIDPPSVDGGPVLAVALVGVVVNLAATWVLSGANRRSLNVEGAFQHVLTDLFAFVATAVAGVVILTTGYHRADGIAALLVAALMLRSGWSLLLDSGRVLLEAAPRGIDPQEIGRALAAESHVVEVHDLHVWEVTSGMPSLSAHVTVRAGCDTQTHRRKLADLVRDRFGIEHSTLQVEARHEGPLEIEPLHAGH